MKRKILPTVGLIEEGPGKLDSYVLYVGKKDKPSWPPFEPRNPTRNYVLNIPFQNQNFFVVQKCLVKNPQRENP